MLKEWPGKRNLGFSKRSLPVVSTEWFLFSQPFTEKLSSKRNPEDFRTQEKRSEDMTYSERKAISKNSKEGYGPPAIL
jgi:hypothetical protein